MLPAKKLFTLLVVFLSLNAFGYDVKTFVPPNASKYLPLVQGEQTKYFSDTKYPEYIPGLIEQESCISLTHSKCWSPNSKLKTSRELGIGIGQITKAFNSNGSIRFDALTDQKNLHKEELKDVSWENIEGRVDLQARTMVLMTRDNYKKLFQVTNEYERLAMADAAYNGGIGGLLKERRYCGLRGGCDPQKWFSNIETTCLKSKRPIYGKRSACDINREHVSNVFKLRMNKYKKFYKE